MGEGKTFIGQLYDSLTSGMSLGGYSIDLGRNELHTYPTITGDKSGAVVNKAELSKFYDTLRELRINPHTLSNAEMDSKAKDCDGLQLGYDIYSREGTPLEVMYRAGHEAGHVAVELQKIHGTREIYSDKENELAAQDEAIRMFSPDGLFPNEPAYRESLRLYRVIDNYFSKN